MKMKPLEYVRNVAIGFDQLANTVFFGFPDETLSARCGRQRHRNPYKFWVKVIDAIFLPFQGPDHCLNAHIKERERKAFYQSPEYDATPLVK